MLWLFLFAVKIAETVRFQVDKILIGAEALRRVIDLVEEVAMLRFGFEHADSLVRRRSFGRTAAKGVRGRELQFLQKDAVRRAADRSA